MAVSAAPGSGKTTFVNTRLLGKHMVYVCSADHFFCNKEGEYVFIPSLLEKAHEDCFAGAQSAIKNRWPMVALDNTNIEQCEYEKGQTPFGAFTRATQMEKCKRLKNTCYLLPWTAPACLRCLLLPEDVRHVIGCNRLTVSVATAKMKIEINENARQFWHVIGGLSM